MLGAEAMARALIKEGVRVIFGIPGLSNMKFYDALYDHVKDGTVRLVLVRHEQAAAHAADGYARASGFPGVCTATSGPGALNLVTGIATAYWDSSPVIAITGQVPTSSMGKMAFQEADIVGVMQNISKFVIRLSSADEIPLWVKNAFHIALTGRPGPVVIDVPRDLWVKPLNSVKLPDKPMVKGYREFSITPDPTLIKKAAELLINAEKPLILVGAGVMWSNATEELLRLSELLIAPMVSTFLGKAAIPHNHPLYLGMMGYYGRAEANHAFMESDVVLVVGARLSDRTITSPKDAEGKKMIMINIDPTDIERAPVKIDVGISADAKIALNELTKALEAVGLKNVHSEWVKRVMEFRDYYSRFYYNDDDGKGLKPWRVLKTLREILPTNTIVTTGVGSHQMWSGIFWDVLKPRTFISSGGMGTMGFGFPAALGAKLARPSDVVVDLDGDGSFLMTANNLATAVEENIPVTVVVFDNRVLGLVRQVQDLFFGSRIIAVELGYNTNFIKLAESFGAIGFDAQSYEDLATYVKKAIKEDAPAVIRVPVAEDELALPTLPPGASLKEMILRDPRKAS
uniref:Acetolactate synthase n=1 Tax=Ignisphaera aggregans TaxID=334771 RepID=A0A7C2VH09_9CREN